MNRLRIRVELNRRRTGVPMHELVSVVDETHKFFQLLAEDVHIEGTRGEWHASNFDPESLNFTAEFDGPASAPQISAFGSAFAGATSLRRETIAQFTRIADFIAQDEMVGFGLYQSDQETEPSDWRCLSRVDALRFAEEIRLLAKATGESESEAPLPAVLNGSVGGRRLFKDRRERETLSSDPGKWIRQVESGLSRRIALLEGEAESQARKMQALEKAPKAADERFLKLLSAMESFCSQAPRQLALAAPEAGNRPLGLDVPQPRPAGNRASSLGWVAVALAATALIVATTKSSTIESLLSKSLGFGRMAQPVQAASITTAPNALNAPLPTPSLEQPRRGTVSETVRPIALDIPPELREMAGPKVWVNVVGTVDREGKVTAAEIESTKGESAGALVSETLKVARWLHFLPANQGKASTGATVITFTFHQDSAASDGARQTGN